jgi:hypothetical protein
MSIKLGETIGDLLKACCACKTEEDANELLNEYKKTNPEYAEQNIGYILGYLGDEERNRLYALFKTCNHPIFGAVFGRGKDPTTKEAFDIGVKMGEESNEKNK